MNVYIVMSYWGSFDYKYHQIEGVYSSRDKAQKVINSINEKYIITKESNDKFESLCEIRYNIDIALDELIQNGTLGEEDFEGYNNKFEEMFYSLSGITSKEFNELKSIYSNQYTNCIIKEMEVQ